MRVFLQKENGYIYKRFARPIQNMQDILTSMINDQRPNTIRFAVANRTPCYYIVVVSSMTEFND